MKTLVLAGGRGRRLGALTAACPKPLILLHGRPILEHLLRNAVQAGLREFVIAIGYQAEKIQTCFRDGSALGVHIEYLYCGSSNPEQPIFVFRSRVQEESFCCFCGDCYLRSDQIAELLRVQKTHAADATFLVEAGNRSSEHRVKVEAGRIVGSSRDPADSLLTYNFVMKSSVLREWTEAAENQDDPSLARTIDVLAGKFRLIVADVGCFVNINSQDDLARAEKYVTYVSGFS